MDSSGFTKVSIILSRSLVASIEFFDADREQVVRANIQGIETRPRHAILLSNVEVTPEHTAAGHGKWSPSRLYHKIPFKLRSRGKLSYFRGDEVFEFPTDVGRTRIFLGRHTR